MTRIIGKRNSLHKNLAEHQQRNKALKFQIGQLQALANIGTTTCMVAHEINNLLTPLGSYAELALNNPDDTALTEKAFQKVTQNCKRASKILESMLAVANGESQEKRQSRLVCMVDEIFECLCRDFAKDGITVNTEIPVDLSVWAVPVQIQQVLMNMILNAREAMLAGGGVLNIRAQDNGDVVQIEMSDSGHGIGSGELEKIFELFFSTKKDSGSGLGLAFCKKIIDEHGGYISVDSELTKGTTFKIILPKDRGQKLKG